MSTVNFEKASHMYPGAHAPAVDALDLVVEDGEFMVLVGPSGCGKSTSLRMLAGLEKITAGAIWIGERDVTDVPPKERDIAMVFQNYALYPHMNVAENMGFALKIAGMSKEQITVKVRSAADLLGLGDFLDRKPKALSGGQRQRVAMGRAIVREPAVFLMDEPLSNLDAKLRVQTRGQIATLQRRLGTTTVYVTHDQTEALTMGDRVAVLKDGVLQQVSTPRAMYDAPANAFVAGFIGSPQMNLFQATIFGQTAYVAGQPVTLARAQLNAAAAEGSDAITIGIRPEDVRLSSGTEPGAITAEIFLVEELGANAYIFARAVDTSQDSGSVGTSDIEMVIRVDGRTYPAKGETVHVSIDADHTHAFSTVTGDRLTLTG